MENTWAFLFFFRVLFLLPLLGVAGLRRRGRLGRCQGGGVSFFSCQEWNASAWSGREAGRALARASFDFFPAARREPGPAVGRTAAVFWEGFLFFFRARQEAAWGASRRRVLRRSPFFFRFLRRSRRPRAAGAFFVVRLFFFGFCVARGGPRPPSAGGRRSSTPPRRVFSPSFFLFFPLAWQDRARVELAVKARSSSLGCRPFFFPVRTRSSTPRRPVPPWRRHGCWSSNGRRRDPFFFGVGRDPQTRFAGGPDEGDRLAGAFPFLLFPPFWGGFPWSGHTRGGPGGGLAGRESLDAGLPGPLPVVFPPPPCPPVAPRQADALALRREVERLQAHPSIVEIDRLQGSAAPPSKRGRGRGPPRRRFPPFFSDRSLAGV